MALQGSLIAGRWSHKLDICEQTVVLRADLFDRTERIPEELSPTVLLQTALQSHLTAALQCQVLHCVLWIMPCLRAGWKCGTDAAASGSAALKFLRRHWCAYDVKLPLQVSSSKQCPLYSAFTEVPVRCLTLQARQAHE